MIPAHYDLGAVNDPFRTMDVVPHHMIAYRCGNGGETRFHEYDSVGGNDVQTYSGVSGGKEKRLANGTILRELLHYFASSHTEARPEREGIPHSPAWQTVRKGYFCS